MSEENQAGASELLEGSKKKEKGVSDNMQSRAFF